MNKKILIGAGIAALLLIATVASAKGGSKNKAPLIITDFDSAYDYKYEAGKWFTHRKGETDWRDMQANLSASNYALAIQRLMNYVTQKGITI